MLSFKFVKRDSMAFVVGVSVLMFILAIAFPMRTSLGQGVDEYVIRGWVGVLDSATHTYSFRMEYTDGTHQDIPMKPIGSQWFTQRIDAETTSTSLDEPAVISAAYSLNPTKVERLLGTYRNVPSFMKPFTQAPVAYSDDFIKRLLRAHISLTSYGGPALPSTILHILPKLSGGSLQIDTGSDANTLQQCRVGQVPAVAAALLARA